MGRENCSVWGCLVIELSERVLWVGQRVSRGKGVRGSVFEIQGDTIKNYSSYWLNKVRERERRLT